MAVKHKIKSCLAKVKIAQLNKKKILKIKSSLINSVLLDVLWENGFIYGYSIVGKYCNIFLKYNLEGQGLLESLVLVNSTLSSKKIINLLHLNSYCGCFVITAKKKIRYCSGNRFLNLNQLIFGGDLIAKV